MKKGLVKFLCSLIAAVSLLSPFVVSATEFPGAPEVASSSALVFNLETEEILYQKNTDGRLDPAAFTKLMTALLAFEYRAQNGNIDVVVKEEMLSSAGGTSMNLKVEENISFDDLLSGLVVQNANDAALVIASVVGGNITSFVEKMNDRAKALKMENTYYSNPTGVDSATMYTTLSDVLLLCKALYRVNDFMLLSEKEKVTIPATNLTGERVYTNKNALVPYSYVLDYYMSGVRGMVAGFTPRAGYCVATVREKKASKNLVIVSGGMDRSELGNGTDISSYRDAKNLMEWAEDNFAVREVVPASKVVCERKVRLASGVDHMILITGKAFVKLLPVNVDLEKEIRTEIRTDKKTYTAPIIEGTSYGKMDIIYEGQVIGTVPLVARSNIGLSRWLVAWDAVKGFFSHGPAKVVLILVILSCVFYVLYLFYTVFAQYRKQNKARQRAINELMEQEKKRMEKVRREEWKLTQARMKKVRSAFRAGFQVLQGDMEEDPAQSPKKPASKAVAKVPEKYRTHSTSPRNPALPPRSQASGQRNQKPGESYRVSRPSGRGTDARGQRRPQDPGTPRRKK